MDNYEFYVILEENAYFFIGLLIISLLIHYLIFKSIISTFLDPYFLGVVSSVFSFAVVFILALTNNISLYLLGSYLLTQISFWIGIHSFRSLKDYNELLNDNKKTDRDKQFSFGKNFSFYFFSTVFIISQLSIYFLKGIPLFMTSRLETFADGGGEGVLGRITDVSSIFILYYFFDCIQPSKLNIKDIPKWIVISFLFLSFILSGSKSSFLITFSVFWSYMVYSSINKVDYYYYLNIFKANYKKAIFISLIIVSGIIFTQQKNEDDIESTLNPVFALGLRFIHSGDVYWYAYPNNIYNSINGTPGFKALFTDALGLLRIYKYEDLPEAIGITLKNIHHPSDVVSGPNARHNVFGLIYYGFFGSIIFSFVLGAALSFSRNVLPRLLRYSPLSGFVFTYLAVKLPFLETDPMLALTYVNNILFVFPLLYLVNVVLTEVLIGISLKKNRV